MIGAVGIDVEGHKHPLGVVEGAIENTATVQALVDNLIERGLDSEVCRLFIVDGSKALTKAILEGLDEILTVIRPGIPPLLRRSLASTNIIESMNAVIRQVCRNVKRWCDARIALRWTAAGMLEAGRGFRHLKACKQLPVLKAALEKHRGPQAGAPVDPMARAA